MVDLNGNTQTGARFSGSYYKQKENHTGRENAVRDFLSKGERVVVQQEKGSVSGNPYDEINKQLERLLYKMDKLENQLVEERELVKRLEQIVEKHSHELAPMAEGRELLSMEESLKKWLGTARVIGHVIILIAENLESILNTISNLKNNNQMIMNNPAVAGERAELAALLPALKSALEELAKRSQAE